jgi:SNF2 family DNA or RNA helicase
MTAMRIIATVPQFINKKLGQEIYKGSKGGGKLYHIATLAKNKILAGEKVVILSDFIEMQKTVAEELKPYGAIRFDTSWNDDERKEAFQSFSEDPNVTCLVAGTRAVSESLDLSAADYCICCDTLWSPATQCQAWSRILTPIERKRSCEIYIVLSDNSIDEHIYSVFYSKLQMSEQAMDHRTINRRAMEINYQWFAERVIQEEANLTIQLRGTDSDEITTGLVADTQEAAWEERE